MNNKLKITMLISALFFVIIGIVSYNYFKENGTLSIFEKQESQFVSIDKK
jgi:hypothetical protein